MAVEGALAGGDPRQHWAWSLRRDLVIVAIIANAVIAVLVLSPGALRLEHFRLDPGRALVLVGMLSFPALLEASAIKGRPATLTEAAITSVLLSPISLTGATGPMLIVGVLYLVARAGVRTRVFFPVGLLRVMIASGSLVLAFISVLFLTEDRCIHTQTSSSCTDAAVTPLGGLIGVGALALGFWASRSLSAPSSRTRVD